jgi:hypothetical protein
MGHAGFNIDPSGKPTADPNLYVTRTNEPYHIYTIIPDVPFFFMPTNAINQILDFGLPAPIDLLVARPITRIFA